jgi:hypothetical protein
VEHASISALAARQRGLITHGQARAAGLSGDAIRRRLSSGLWERVHFGVSRVAGAPRTWEQDLLAACLAAGPGAAGSHRAAAWSWELDGIDELVVEIATPRPTRRSLDGVIVHRSTSLNATAIVDRDGIPVTNPHRTLLDLGAVAPRWVVERAVDHALGKRLVTLDGLGAVLEADGGNGRRGAGTLREVLRVRSIPEDVTDSVLEARMLRLLRASGVPLPIPQFDVRRGPVFVARVDFAYPELRLAIEVDGYERHASHAAFAHDRARQNALVELGWTVLRFTWDDVVHRPEHVVATILRLLGTYARAKR